METPLFLETHRLYTIFFKSIPPTRHQPWELWHASDAITSVSVVSAARKDEMLRASAQSPDNTTRKIRIPKDPGMSRDGIEAINPTLGKGLDS